MRSKVGRTLVLALLLCGVSVAQQPGAAKKREKSQEDKSGPQIKQINPKTQQERPQLEEMLAEALNYNPDLRVAAAKLAEAEATLHRARVQITQQVVALNQDILLQRAIVDAAQRKYDRVTQKDASGTPEPERVDQAGVEMAIARAKLDQLEAQMMGLLGKAAHPAVEQQNGNGGEYRRPIGEIAPVTEAELRRQALNRGRLAEDRGRLEDPVFKRMRKALLTPVKVDYKDMTFDQILKDLAKKVEGLSFRNLSDPPDPKHNKTYNLRFEEAMPVSAILQALADESGCLFFVREYGILATNQPRPAMTVEEFLRYKPAPANE